MERALDDRLAEGMGLLNVCAAEVVDLIGEALRTGAWQGFGIRSPEHWVTWKCGVSPGRARRLVELARTLADLPETARRFRAGQLTEDQVAVIARHTDAEHDAQVATLATSLTVPQLNRVLPGIPRPSVTASAPTSGTEGTSGDDDRDRDTASQSTSGAGEAEDLGTADPRGEDKPGGRRDVAMGYDHSGSFWCSITLPADEGALMERALVEARQAEFLIRHPGADRPVETRGVTWADALVRLVESGLSALDPATAAGRSPSERTQVILHLDAEGDAPPRLHLGPVLPPSQADYLSCDATVRSLLARDGVPVARGRRRRTVDSGLRIVIENRDQGCRVPGCGHRRWLHIHHIVHWSRGGTTQPSNLVALCPTHHRMVHSGRLRISGDPSGAGLRWCDERGRALLPSRPRPPAAPPADAARSYGLPLPDWRHPAGEPLDSRWITWD